MYSKGQQQRGAEPWPRMDTAYMSGRSKWDTREASPLQSAERSPETNTVFSPCQQQRTRLEQTPMSCFVTPSEARRVCRATTHGLTASTHSSTRCVHPHRKLQASSCAFVGKTCSQCNTVTQPIMTSAGQGQWLQADPHRKEVACCHQRLWPYWYACY